MNAKKFWHYTFYEKYLKMIESGCIKRSVCCIDLGEIPVVWFSTNPDWEQTVRKSIINPTTGQVEGPFSRDDLSKYGQPPVRLEINQNLVKVYSWRHFRKNSGISKTSIKIMLKLANQWCADPKQWRVSYEDVPLEKVIHPIEIWNGYSWIDIQAATLIEKPLESLLGSSP